MKPTASSIFSIQSNNDFEKIALEIFRYQAEKNKVYNAYLKGLKTNTEAIKSLNDIPFLPIEFFKTQKVINDESSCNPEEIFTSSGTTGTQQSKHYVCDIELYEKSYRKAFNLFYGDVQSYCILALLPSYLEREGSSLIYMVNDLIKQSQHAESGFYLDNYNELLEKIKSLKGKKVLLIGVTYALLDLSEIIEKENIEMDFSTITIMETGGMKGKREELVREELHTILCNAFNTENIHSEYGMTELLSQAYSKGKGVFHCPPWMKVLIRDTNDPFSILAPNKTGGVNVIDLANLNSCSFIATQDLGRINNDGSFEVLGRYDNSDIRGCNLLVG